MYVHYFLEQLKSPLFKKLPIIQKIIHGYLAQAYTVDNMLNVRE